MASKLMGVSKETIPLPIILYKIWQSPHPMNIRDYLNTLIFWMTVCFHVFVSKLPPLELLNFSLALDLAHASKRDERPHS